jgi:OmpA-OmpF porin, OOP family
MKRVLLGAFALVALSAANARADCASPHHLSTCIDADTFWPHASAGPFSFVGGTGTVGPGLMAFGLVTTYLHHPLMLALPTASPEPTEVAAVGDLVDTTFLWSLGLSDRAELELSLPTTTYRTGTGVSALVSQQASPLPRTGLRDLRVGAAYTLVPKADGHLGLASRLEVGVPTGDEASFAGDRSLVAIPAFTAELQTGPWMGAAEVGARLREPADLAGSRVGSQLFLALGAGTRILDDDLLAIALELMALPTFAHQAVATSVPATGGQRQEVGKNRALVPAEWALSVSSSLWPSSHLSIALAGGGGIDPMDAPAITTPKYRFSLMLRYTP